MEALRRIKEKGVSRRITGVEIDGDPLPALNFAKWPASREGKRVGKVTSAIFSPRLKKNIGYCWVPADLAAPGTKLEIASEWGARTATVVAMPFVDPGKKIPVS
jgi:aminomethyltransferase